MDFLAKTPIKKGKKQETFRKGILLPKPESAIESISYDMAWKIWNPGAGNGIPIRGIFSPFIRNTPPHALGGNGRDSTGYRSDIFCPVPVGIPGFPPKNVTPILPFYSKSFDIYMVFQISSLGTHFSYTWGRGGP
jgi:hypothetical protein